MARYHIIQISDVHLSETRSYNQAGWEATLDHIAGATPDFVVVTGDLILDDPDCHEDHLFASSQLARIPHKWGCLPGNHDIGDTNPHPYMGQHLNEDRLTRYKHVFGKDYWYLELGSWLILGLNAFLPGSGLVCEQLQYDWLREIVRQNSNRKTIAFIHKPLCINRFTEQDFPDVCVVSTGRDQLLEILGGVDLRLIGSGHNHHYRTFSSAGIQMVWAPSTSQIFRAPRLFAALLTPGLVNYWLDDDGTLEFGLTEPSGITPADVTELVTEYGSMRSSPPKEWQYTEACEGHLSFLSSRQAGVTSPHGF